MLKLAARTRRRVLEKTGNEQKFGSRVNFRTLNLSSCTSFPFVHNVMLNGSEQVGDRSEGEPGSDLELNVP